MYEDYRFDFERLDVYQRALKFSNDIFTVTRTFPKDIQFSLGDQFRRASLSVCNNIAEGSRKIGRAKRQFYDYAFDSARECVPMISLATSQNQITKEQESYLRSECVQICNMIYRLICSVKV